MSLTGSENAGSGIDLGTFRDTYFDECAELLETVYGHFAALDDGRGDDDTIHAIFRAVHSIKGGGGVFGFARVVGFAHAFETLLDMLRDGRVAFSPALARLMLRATDMLADLLAGARAGTDVADDVEAGLLQDLQDAADAPMLPAAPAAAAAPVMQLAAAGVERRHIRFTPHASLYASANEPLLIFRELARHGALTVTADTSRIPDLTSFDPDGSYIGWTIELDTPVPSSVLEEAFEFVTEDCDLAITTRAPPPPAGAGAGVGTGVDAGRDDAPAARPPPERQAASPAAAGEAARAAHSIRLDVEKIDRLVNLVGELVINQAMLAQVGANLPPDLAPGLTGGLAMLSQHLRELQEGVMAIRAQPVRSVFSRMPRLVRELAGQLGKDVRLVVTGEGTEIDKTVVEQLADPLTHLLRNSLDHGIERPADRERAGKRPQGTVSLSAEHRSGRIIIEVADDGRGIDRDKVLARARTRGLVPPEVALTDDEIDELLFLPGFSTADAVSSISGRGVGMDVVRRNIQALGGRITVASRPGLGARFTLSLPLTLAILDGMAVAVGAETYIVPLTNIMESLRPKPADLHPIVGRGDVLAIRGDYVPLVHLHRVFGVPGATSDPCRGTVVIVESESAGRLGVVVDEMLGQQQVVVKSLEANYGQVDGIGGATILGNGRVALILDVARLHAAAATALLT